MKSLLSADQEFFKPLSGMKVTRPPGTSKMQYTASMKNLLFIITLTIAWFLWPQLSSKLSGNPPPEVLTNVSRSAGDKAIRKVEFMSLLDRKKDFSSLAKSGYYTVVEVYLDSCSICRKLESGFDAFTSKRKDIFIQRVHVPEEGIHFSFQGSSEAEIQRQADETNRLMESYDMCGTPHVLIYGPDKQVIAKDSCGSSRAGTNTLRSWINTETGLLSGNLGGITSMF